jgi:hypothetical protein
MLFAIPELHELSADHGRANTKPIPLLESFAQPAKPMLKIRDIRSYQPDSDLPEKLRLGEEQQRLIRRNQLVSLYMLVRRTRELFSYLFQEQH